MNYQVIISLTARQEETDAYLYYEDKLEGLGDKFLQEVEASLNKISLNPTFFSYCDTSRSLRDFALQQFPFVIIYEILEEKIIVTNIHHTKKELK
jgi:hypothetical protein